MNIDVPYGITTRLAATNLAAARERVTAALAAEGFGVLTEIDVAATLQKKLGVTMEPYVILGACNPKLAHQAISADPGIGLLLPCNVVVAQDGADVVVSAVSPRSIFAVVQGQPGMEEIAGDAEARLRRAVQSLGK